MAFWMPLLAGLGGLLIGSSIGKKKEPEVVTQPALHPGQEEVMGELTSAMKKIIADYGSGNAMADALARADRVFRETVELPIWEQYETIMLPQVQQSFAGPGTFWGSDRARAETNLAQDIASQLASSRAGYMNQAQEAERAYQLNQMNQVLSYMGLPTTVSYAVPQTPGLLQQLLQISPQLLATYLAYGGMG
jgi:hypothetical protein